MAELRNLNDQKVRAHRSRFLARTIDCITLHTSPLLQAQGRTVALSDNFLPVEVEEDLPANRLVTLFVTGTNPDATLLRCLSRLIVQPESQETRVIRNPFVGRHFMTSAPGL